MFESHLQTAQFCLFISVALEITGVLTLAFGPIAVGLFVLVLGHAMAAVGCYMYAEVKGYPGLIGIPIGVAIGFVGAVIMIILPDETRESALAEEKRLAREGLKPTRRKDPGYEVLDDGEDD